MSKIITNWENDLIDSLEPIVSEWVKKHYPNYELKLLSGLRHRSMEDIYDSLRSSRIIVMQPSLIDGQQVADIVKEIGHSIHVNFNGATREWDLRDFVFLSMNPFKDLQEVTKACIGLRDRHGEDPLAKILKSVDCYFYGFAGEK